MLNQRGGEMKKALIKIFLGVCAIGFSPYIFAAEIDARNINNQTVVQSERKIEMSKVDKELVLQGELDERATQSRIGIIDGDKLVNTSYENKTYINKGNGPSLKFYIESYNSDYIKYKVKCNDMTVMDGLINGKKSKTFYIKAQDAEYEILLNNSENGNDMDGFIRVVQDKK